MTPSVILPAPSPRPRASTAAPVHYASSTHVARRADLRPIARLPLLHGRWRQTLRLAAETTKSGGPPILLLVIAFAFITAQDRIDRNDPKLALAPVHGHQELTFKPIDRGTP